MSPLFTSPAAGIQAPSARRVPAGPRLPAPPATRPPRDPRPRLVPPPPPAPPTWGQRMIPRGIRSAMADLGLWQEPRPLKPSYHLAQVIEVLARYGWCQTCDFSPTGRMCIRGAQTFLESAGHVTPVDREKAVNYLQSQLAVQGVNMAFWQWNDLSTNTFQGVEAMISAASDMARKNGE
ncbi:hypothetical protein ACFY8X_39075 [Streptomyces tanashiensis]|uniref:DUF6197 family protein n=1 Tax=Streptomyces tanashiensis TaxID=67367 RepID=UPI0036ED223C